METKIKETVSGPQKVQISIDSEIGTQVINRMLDKYKEMKESL